MQLLNALCPSGLPPHLLHLKVGMPVMILRKLNGELGQVNGTRAIVRGMGNTVLDLELATGSRRGDRVFDSDLIFTPQTQSCLSS